MRPEVREEVEQWLARAKRDLLVAERTLQGTEPLADASVFHSQQAAEKALKGFLTAHLQPFPKTHDLGLLLRQCQSLDPEFARFAGAANALTPYAVRFRYPGGPMEPDLAEAQQAVKRASEIVDFTRQKLS